MTFQTYEGSRNQGVPVTLYLFRYGSSLNSFFAYTDSDEPVIFEGIEYLPGTISRDAVTASGTLDKNTMQITTNFNSGLANLFLTYPPSYVITAVIRQGHLSDPDNQFLVSWSGRVLSCAFKGNEASFTCEPISTSLKRPGLRRNYQYGCPHALYGDKCNASKPAGTVNTTVSGVTGAFITLPASWNVQPVDKYLNGVIEWQDILGDTNLRSILKIISPTVLLMSGAAPSLEIGQAVSVSLGCARTMDDCLNLHNNIHNYGGQPFIPTKNPLSNQNQFY